MIIHVVDSNETLYTIAQRYNVPYSLLLYDNQLPDPANLVVGQTIVIRIPAQVHTVQQGQTLSTIARQYGVQIKKLQQNNPVLGGSTTVYPGQTLVISYQDPPENTISVNGYAYPFIDKNLLLSTLPYLTYLTPFTYGITAEGNLVDLDDSKLISMAYTTGTASLMHLSTLTEDGGFSNELANLILNNREIQNRLIENIIRTLQNKGYRGLDVDFEFVFPEDADAYAGFIRNLRNQLNPLGYPVIVALAPKTSANQRGLLYEGHNYRLLGEAADEVLLMTYEWGYTYGPPMAVAPLPNVRAVVEYALSEISSRKIWLGIPNYGYDWPLPFVQGQTRATSISNRYAVQLAARYGVEIQFDTNAQAPWFRYRDEQGQEHEVWFEDARSMQRKLALISEYNLLGAGYWNLMRPFPQNWPLLASLYNIQNAL